MRDKDKPPFEKAYRVIGRKCQKQILPWPYMCMCILSLRKPASHYELCTCKLDCNSAFCVAHVLAHLFCAWRKKERKPDFWLHINFEKKDKAITRGWTEATKETGEAWSSLISSSALSGLRPCLRRTCRRQLPAPRTLGPFGLHVIMELFNEKPQGASLRWTGWTFACVDGRCDSLQGHKPSAHIRRRLVVCWGILLTCPFLAGRPTSVFFNNL